MTGSADPRAAAPFRVALTFDVEHHDRPATADGTETLLGLQRFNGIYYREPGFIQAGTLMTLIIPVIAFLLTQRFFTRGIVITGVDK